MTATRARATGLSFSHHTTVALFGGFTPTIAAALIETTGPPVSPGYCLPATSVSSTAALTVAQRGGRIQ
ncbi:hypothetical protein [Streptomyces sp. 3213.3]|uniref:hypothetical protein n=1 Tax=Streptomyces sp. 3213.3 TaxID=1855348 RepID=UPI001F18BCAD|nr:hypothetical protein [Streptomyces sp. 3213.3]